MVLGKLNIHVYKDDTKFIFSLCTKVNERIRNLKLSKYPRKTFQNAAIDKNFLKRSPKVEGIITIELH